MGTAGKEGHSWLGEQASSEQERGGSSHVGEDIPGKDTFCTMTLRRERQCLSGTPRAHRERERA